jgi:hypothetical protein
MKIVFCKKMPDWIRSSEKAAYSPHYNTIYLTSIKHLPHEFIHWFAHKFRIPVLHEILDGTGKNKPV